MKSIFRHIQVQVLASVLTLFSVCTSAFAFDGGETVYLQFPLVSRAIYVADDGTVKAGTYTEADGKMWTLVDDADGNSNTWRLKDENGNYLTPTADGNGVTVTTTETDATAFTLTEITYVGITQHRYEITCDSKYLQVSEDGTVTLNASHESGNVGYPYSIVRLSGDLNGPQLPALGDTEYQYIYFPKWGGYLKDMGHAQDVSIAPYDPNESSLYLWTVVQAGNGYFIKSVAGNYLHIKNNGEPFKAASDDQGRHRLVEDADNTETVCGLKKNSLWRIRRRITGSGNAMHPDYPSATDHSIVKAYERTASDDDCYFCFETQPAEQFCISFPLTGLRALHATEGGGLSGKSYTTDENIAFSWFLENTGTENEYRLRSLATHQYIKLNGTNDRYILTDNAAEALVFTRSYNNAYNIRPENNRYSLSFTVGSETKYFGCNDDGTLGMYETAESRFATIRIADNVVGPTLPQIAVAGRPSTVKWYRMRYMHSGQVVKDAAEGENLQLTDDDRRLTSLWKLTDTGSGNGDVYLESYAKHQPAGGLGDKALFTASTTSRAMRLQEWVEQDNSAYPNQWKLRTVDNEQYYFGGFVNSPADGGDGNMRGLPYDWTATLFTFEEVTDLFPAIFSTETEDGISLSLAFNDKASDNILNITDDALSLGGNGDGWHLVGTADGFKVYHLGNSKYIKASGTTLTLTDDAAEATEFILQPNNSIATDRIVWSLALKNNPDKAIVYNGDGVEIGNACTANSSIDIQANSTSGEILIQFSANGRTLLSTTADGAIKAVPVSAATNQHKWEKIGIDDDFMLRNHNGQYLTETGEGNLTLTSNMSEALHLKQVTTNFSLLAANYPNMLNRFDFCKADDETLHLAIINEKTGELGWSTLSGTRYTTVYLTTELNGPEVMPASEPLDNPTAPAKWYKIHFVYNDHYLTTAQAGTEYIAKNAVLSSDIQSQSWRFVHALSANGTDLGEYYLQDFYGHYLYYTGSRYRLTNDISEAARLRLVEDLENTGIIDGHTTQKRNLWRLKRTDAAAGNTMHQPFGGASNPDIGEYNADAGGNYFTIEECEPVSHPIIQTNPDDITETNNVTAIRFCTAGTMGLYLDGNTVKAKIREDDDENFKWGLCGTAQSFYVTNPEKTAYLKWDGTAMVAATTVAEATQFSLQHSAYEELPERWDICSADGKQILSVNPATGVVTMDTYQGSTRLTTVNFVDDISTKTRELFDSDKYLRISFAGSSHRLGTNNTMTGIRSYRSEVKDNLFNLWRFVPRNAKRGDYYLRNANGEYLRGEGFTADITLADVFCLIEGADEEYWQLYYNHKSQSMCESDPVKYKIGVVHYNEAGNTTIANSTADIIFDFLTEEEVNTIVGPALSTEEDGNFWFYMQQGEGTDVLSVQDYGDATEPKGVAQRNRFSQIWRLLRTDEMHEGQYLVQSNSGNYLHREVTTDSEGNEVVRYTTSSIKSEATMFTFEGQYHDACKRIHWYPKALAADGTVVDKYIYMNGSGIIVETTDPETARHLMLNPAPWYIDRQQHKVLHKRNGIYDKQGVSAEVTGLDKDGLQSTNEYYITRCVKKGESIVLESPTYKSAYEYKHTNYQRWFDHTTYRGTSNSILSLDEFWQGTKQILAYSNGYVLGESVTSGHSQGQARFFMPANAGEVIHEVAGDTVTIPNEYVISFEMSRYTDKSGFDNPDIDPTEATLQLRANFHVFEGQIMADSLKKYPAEAGIAAENISITFPTQVHGTAGYNTYSYKYEVVPLNMRADSYYCWNEDSTDYFAPGLKVELEDTEGLGIQLRKSTMSGTDRVIEFTYPNNGKLENANGKKVIFKVYTNSDSQSNGKRAGRFLVAKYEITFLDEVDAMLFKDVIGNKTIHRSPEYLNEHFGNPVAQLTFDDDLSIFKRPDNGSVQSNTCGFPLPWDQVSYAYYPVRNKIQNNNDDAAWGEYALIRIFQYGFGNDDTEPIFHDMAATYSNYYKNLYDNASEEDKPKYKDDYDTYYGTSGKSGAMVYIDSSEKPGDIASLVFDGNLCPGSKMYCSAWIASGNDNASASPASVIMDLVGVKEDGSETKIYSYCPGQVMGRYYYHDTGTTWIPEQNKDYDGGWQQIFFSFSDTSGATYTKYLLRVRNNCMNSAGGDILIDNIKVYISRANVEVTQAAPVCGTAINFMTIEANFNTLLNTMGVKNGVNEHRSVWYCFLDKEKFDNIYAGNLANTEKAFNQSLLGDPSSSQYGKGAFHRATFSTILTDNPEYSYAAASKTDRISTFRRHVDGSDNIVFVDRIEDVKMEPGKEYYVVLVPDAGWNQSDFIRYGHTLLSPTGSCSVNNTFKATAAYSIKINNDESFSDASIKVCAGASTTLRTELVGTDEDGNTVTKNFYHDWWLDYLTDAGPFNEQKTTASDGTDLYLSDALEAFRGYNPKAETLENAKTGPGNSYLSPFTQEMLDYLKTFVEPAGPDKPARLLLYRNAVTVSIPTGVPEGKVTVLPITPSVKEETSVIYCYDPIQLTIQIAGKAPWAKVGLQGKTYPKAVDYVPLRLGLGQIAHINGAADENVTADTPVLKLPFYIVHFAYPETADRIAVSDLYHTGSQSYGTVRLAGTNDPRYDYDATHLAENENLYRIGKVTNFEVRPGDANYMADIRFNSDFQPREGYYYTLRFEFEEQYPAGQEPEGDLCSGAAITTMKVVPEYAIWTGAANSDWTNDNNWLRADLNELNPGGDTLLAENPLHDYTTNADNGRNTAYVPMSFTSVLLPEEAGVSATLYEVEQTPTDFLQKLNNGTATPYIQYDMLLQSPVGSEKNYSCGLFTTQQCDGVTIKAGGELVRSDLLVYNKAWMEYRLKTDRWYTLGTPFEKTFAGDWYVPTATGRQQSPYFQPIRFNYNLTFNHRYKPAVYQRSWDKQSAKLYLLNGSSTLETGQNYEEVAVKADWSGVFNDVQETYDLNGFSLKVVPDGAHSYANDEVLFRIPTEDTSYKYFNPAKNTYEKEQGIDRTVTHRFHTTEFEQTLTNKVPNNPYYLVTNPFPCGMSLNQFFEGNTGLAKKYWIVTENGQQTAIKDESAWTTVNGTESDVVLAPGQGFFVKVETAGGWEIYFNSATMMTSAKANRSTILRAKQNAPLLNTLHITAEREGLHTTAIVRESDATSKDFLDSEDLECFIDLSVTGLPYVYTMAGHQAASINRLPALQCVPLGVQGVADDKEVVLTFRGAEGFVQPLYLYDKSTDEKTALTEGFTLRVTGNSHGRYYIMTDMIPEVEEELHEPTISIDGQTVSISSPSAVGTVRTYDMGGRLLYHHDNITGTSHSFTLTPGVYTVEMRGEHNYTRKIVVN